MDKKYGELADLQEKLNNSVFSSEELRLQVEDIHNLFTASETSNAQLSTQLASNAFDLARSQQDAATIARLEGDVVRVSNERDGSINEYRQGFLTLSSQANVHIQAAISSL